MALIEHLEKDEWEKFLRDTFDFVLWVLEEDRFRHIGSGASDLRGWLVAGGVESVKYHLQDQMEMRRIPAEQQTAINHCIEQLATEHRSRLLALVAKGVIPSAEPLAYVNLFSSAELDDLLEHFAQGERPFEEWMYTHGYSIEDVAKVYREIDAVLLPLGIIPPPFPPQKLH